MALISSKGVYGLRAMYELSCTDNKTPIQIRTIAKNSGISQNYLEQLFSLLRRAGLVSSVRGAHGGYLLSKPPEEISVYEILEALEGDLEIVSKLDSMDPLTLFYKECYEALLKVFNLPLSKLQKYHENLLGQLHYNI